MFKSTRVAAAVVGLLAMSQPVFADFVVIAYNPSTGFKTGFRVTHYDPNAKFNTAGCGYNCQVAAYAYGGWCAALAVGRSGWGGEGGPTLGHAKQSAVQKCRQFSSGCQVVASLCSRP